ncbi:MarR family transcriptional regulator [Clostridium sp. 'deep sea']|uniref:MarR family winged helix-turn-helix transcriptional regulator n=1 Tax=Clostridium sp. 'deep sea' TaxID=2779445 RepID=UPI0018966EA7|nr:MarR family transcriptional regulator [Clostridium sp. 'deep sea']QOR34625.1 MarR family transcriptional regulator [Clostridium sp. 'deep sea']
MDNRDTRIDLINTYLVRLFNQILAIEEKSLTDAGLTNLSMTEMHTIEAVGFHEPCTMSIIAKYLRITLGTLTTSINRLVKKGYVTRYRDSEDRRKVLVELTQKGKEADIVHSEFHKRMVGQMTDDLKLQDKVVLMRSLRNLKHFFDKEYRDVSGFSIKNENIE